MTIAFTENKSLHETLAAWRAAGDIIALVPTMGALHLGHLALVAQAKKQAQRVVVSIFVNPTQFGPNEDFNRYPRPLENDLALLRAAAVDAVWLPTPAAMYPQGFSTSIRVAGISEQLDGQCRPGHFDGVATIVTKLLLHVAPNIAFFGEKDYQQLCVIKQLVDDLNIPVTIIGVPTIREGDGLALSSRNQYLSAAERAIAPQLYATLCTLAAHIATHGASTDIDAQLTTAQNALHDAGFSRIDYLQLRAHDSLAPLAHYATPARLLVAAWLGTTRLIDNVRID
jgi:pantoate--beta-alanine ligase